MATLLLRLCGPMQSWGTQSRFSERDTDREPSKSGVVGLLCAALGRPREEPVDDLAALVMGVRVDAEGHIERDYHTAGGARGDSVARASGGRSDNAVLSNRYYLADADFLVGLESDDEALLHTLETALREPAWQIFLGRKSFVPAVPVHLPGEGGFRDKALVDALAGEPWPLLPDVEPTRRRSQDPIPRDLRLVIEDGAGEHLRMDQPLGAAFAARSFGPRRVRFETCAPHRRDDDVSEPINP